MALAAAALPLKHRSCAPHVNRSVGRGDWRRARQAGVPRRSAPLAAADGLRACAVAPVHRRATLAALASALLLHARPAGATGEGVAEAREEGCSLVFIRRNGYSFAVPRGFEEQRARGVQELWADPATQAFNANVTAVVADALPFATPEEAGKKILAQARTAPGVVLAELEQPPRAMQRPPLSSGGSTSTSASSAEDEVYVVEVHVQRRWTSDPADGDVIFMTSLCAPAGSGRVYIQTIQAPADDAVALRCARRMAEAFMAS